MGLDYLEYDSLLRPGQHAWSDVQAKQIWSLLHSAYSLISVKLALLWLGGEGRSGEREDGTVGLS